MGKVGDREVEAFVEGEKVKVRLRFEILGKGKWKDCCKGKGQLGRHGITVWNIWSGSNALNVTLGISNNISNLNCE